MAGVDAALLEYLLSHNERRMGRRLVVGQDPAILGGNYIPAATKNVKIEPTSHYLALRNIFTLSLSLDALTTELEVILK